jgi:hypothetical protein
MSARSVAQGDDDDDLDRIALTIMCLLVAQTMPASPPTGPRDAVEAAVARFMNIMQNARSDGAAMTADGLG